MGVKDKALAYDQKTWNMNDDPVSEENQERVIPQKPKKERLSGRSGWLIEFKAAAKLNRRRTEKRLLDFVVKGSLVALERAVSSGEVRSQMARA